MLLAVIIVVLVQALSTAAASIVERTPYLAPLLYLVPILPITVCLFLLTTRRPTPWLAGSSDPSPA